jgi:ribonuclease G
MSKEMVISANRHETRVALLEDDQLVEVYFQRANEYSLAGSIHKGRVTRVLPGMQSAFVDLGIERDTFLYVSDFLEEHEDIDRVTDDDRPGRSDRGRDRDRERRPPPPAVSGPPPEAAPAVVSAPQAPAAAVEAPSGLKPPAAPAGGGREDRGDRRGRRSRRRNRGRGFPESKYAADPSAPPGVAQADDAAPEATPELKTEPREEPAPESARLILPGESLAKYRGAPPAPVAPTPVPVEAANVAPDMAPTPTLEVEENEFNEPIHYPPDNVLPDAPAHHAEPVTPEAPPLSEAAIPAEPDVEPDSEPEPEQDDDGAGPAVAPMLDEDEDLDIQAMILGQVEDADGEEVEIEIEEIEIEEGAEPEEPVFSSLEPGVEAGIEPRFETGLETGLESGIAAAPAEPESGTAEVRERGGRYPHRGSRRLRRRARGPQSPGGRDSVRSPERSPERSNEPPPAPPLRPN